MPRPGHAIFRTDASVMIGGGHVRRCLVLAEALAEAGWRVTFVCGVEATEIVPALSSSGFAVMTPPAFEAAVRAPGFACALLVVDDYRLDAGFESACRPWAERIFAIDDLADRRHDCDVLLDQSPGRRPQDYAGLVPEACELLLGPSYALLDPRFRTVRRRRREIGTVTRIFVNFGTTDTANATRHVLDAIAATKLGPAVDIVLGSAAPHLGSIRSWLAQAGARAALHLDVDDMASLMRQADIAIGAGGVGSLERCALGLPSLILTVADNQTGIAAALDAAGAAVYLGDSAGRSAQEIAQAIESLCEDGGARHAMSGAAMGLVDGLGVARVRLSCSPPLLAADGRRVTLRQLRLADAPLLRAWLRRADRGAESMVEPWLRARFGESESVLHAICCDDEPVGILRLDSAATGVEISVFIPIECQGEGVGACALELGQRFWPTESIIAALGPDDWSAAAMFARAGFRQRDATDWILAPVAVRDPRSLKGWV